MSERDSETSIIAPGNTERDEPRQSVRWHGGLDFGLLVLRLVTAAVFIVHGVGDLGGYVGGPGIDEFTRFVADHGFQHAGIFAYITAWTELVGGLFVALGLLLPLATAGLLGVVVSAIVAVRWQAGFAGPDGFQLELVLAGAVFALLFTGPGRIALDNGRRWFRFAPAFGFVFLLISAAATLVVLLAFRG